MFRTPDTAAAAVLMLAMVVYTVVGYPGNGGWW